MLRKPKIHHVSGSHRLPLTARTCFAADDPHTKIRSSWQTRIAASVQPLTVRYWDAGCPDATADRCVACVAGAQTFDAQRPEVPGRAGSQWLHAWAQVSCGVRSLA